MEHAELFGHDLDRYSRTAQYMLVFAGICVCFEAAMIFQDILMLNYRLTSPSFFMFTQFLAVCVVCIPSAVHSGFAVANEAFPWRACFAIAIATTVSSISSVFAINLLGRASEVLFKSTRPFLVFIMELIVERRGLNMVNFLTVVTIVTGLVLFAITGLPAGSGFSINGVIALMIAVLLSVSVTYETHDLLRSKVDGIQVMAVVFGIATLVTGVWTMCDGGFDASCAIIAAKPEAFSMLIVTAATGAAGVHVIYYSLQKFGGLQTVIFTSVRKAIGGMLISQQLGLWRAIAFLIITLGSTVNFWRSVFCNKETPESEVLLYEEADDEMSDDPMDSSFSDRL